MSATVGATATWLEEPAECGPRAGFGVYLHVPFCAHRCGYCDFATYDDRSHLMGRYVGALGEEIRRWSEAGDWPAVTSVYVGGGTPTLLPPADLAGLVDLVSERFRLEPDAEITVEANPETVGPEIVTALAEAGVSRMSLGAQSAAAHVLETLERRHRPERVPAAVAAARAAGIGNVSLDLIYGTPGESDEDWRGSLRHVLDAGADHVSAYALTVAPNTPLARRVADGLVPEPDPDLQRDRYDAADEVLGGAKFEHYEVSSWALSPSRRSRHNVLYWRHGDYLGLGVGAHGHLQGRRFWGHRSVERWLADAEAGRSPVAGEEQLTTGERAAERLLLGLRLREGLHPADVPPLDESAVQSAADAGMIDLSCGRLRVVPDSWFLLDDVVRRLLG